MHLFLFVCGGLPAEHVPVRAHVVLTGRAKAKKRPRLLRRTKLAVPHGPYSNGKVCSKLHTECGSKSGRGSVTVAEVAPVRFSLMTLDHVLSRSASHLQAHRIFPCSPIGS